nr:hypothetical protein [Tanacetum cinerariifolium]
MWGLKECSSGGDLHTKSCDCSKGGFIDMFVHDPNKTPDSSQRPPQDCPKCGNPVDDFLNTSESSNDDSNVVNAPQEPIVFNQDPGENSSQSPPHISHQCCYGCGDSLDGHHETFQCQPMNYYEPNSCNDSFGFDNFQPSQPVIDHLNLQQRINDSMIELCGMFQAWLQQQKDQEVNLDSYSLKPLQYQKIPICYDDDDDEESSTTLSDIIISELPSCIVITPVLSTKDSLITGDEHLDTIYKNESHEFIKPSVENFVPNPSEFEDKRDKNESFSDEDIPKKIYSNPLFDEEIISIKIDPHHFSTESDLIESLLNQDSLIISSSKINSLLDEFFDELIFHKSIPPGIDELTVILRKKFVLSRNY